MTMTIRQPETMTRQSLAEIVQQIQAVIWPDPDPDGQYESPTLERVAQALTDYGLAPGNLEGSGAVQWCTECGCDAGNDSMLVFEDGSAHDLCRDCHHAYCYGELTLRGAGSINSNDHGCDDGECPW